MPFSVGVLYSAQKLIKMASESSFKLEDFLKSFDTFELADTDKILEICQHCNWVKVNNSGVIEVGENGAIIAQYDSAVLRLREQIKSAILIYQPPWAKKLKDGRNEAKKVFPKGVSQCFKEGGLFDDWNEDLIDWWDDLAQTVRAQRNEELLKVGRKAEKLSMDYELERTDQMPIWQSLDSNYSGFDILSVLDSSDLRKKKIEVKGTSLRLKEAYFILSRNEWDTAKKAGNYFFHLWLIKDPPNLIEVDALSIEPHIPSDNEQGSWQQTKIPFNIF